MLGVLLRALPRWEPGVDTQIHALADVRDALLRRAVERTHAADAAPWPAYVRTRYARAIVLLSLWDARRHAGDDRHALVTLGAHLHELLGTEPGWCVGLGVAAALGEELGASRAAAGDNDDSGASALRLRADEHLWCHACVEVHLLPTLVPAVLQVLATLTARAQDAAGAAPPLWQASAHAACVLLGWRSSVLLQQHADEARGWTWAALWQQVQQGDAYGADGPSAGRTSVILAPIVQQADVCALLGATSHAARRVAGGAGEAVAQSMYEALEHLVQLEPLARDDPAWAAQRAALWHVVSAEAASLDAQPRELERHDVLRVQRTAHLMALLLRGASGHALLHGAGSVPALVETLDRLTQLTLHMALALAPAARDAEASLTCDAALDAVLGLWRTLATVSRVDDAAAVRAALGEHVVRPYVAGRLHAAALAADADDEEMGDEQTPDVELYDEQLTLWAMLARMDLPAALRALSAHPPQLDVAHATAAQWEQLHWSALLCGHLVADSAVGETAQVPEAVDAAPGEALSPLWQLLHTYLGLLTTLAQCGPTTPTPASPQTLSTLLWLTARWVPSYLLPNSVTPATAPLCGEGGQHVLETLLACCRALWQVWRSDVDVMQGLASLWHAFTQSPGTMRVLLQDDTTLALVRDMLATLESVPEDAQAQLLRALVRSVDAARDGGDKSVRARDVYYPLLVHAAESRLSQSSGASPTAVATALALWEAIVDAADPQGSGAVHRHLFAQLPAVVELAAAHQAHDHVQLAALRATRAMVRALPELEDVETLLPAAARAVSYLLQGVHSLLEAPARTHAWDTSLEDVLCLYMDLADELVQTGGALPGGVGVAGEASVHALVALAPVLDGDLLAVPRVRDALSRWVHHVLIVARAALVASSPPPATAAWWPSPCELPDPHALVMLQHGAAPGALPMVLRAAVYVLATADALTDASAASVAQGLGFAAEDSRAAWPAAWAPAAQACWDGVVCELCMLLLLRPLLPSMLTPLILALRRVVLARVSDEQLGGAASLMAALAAHCQAPSAASQPGVDGERVAALYGAAVEQVVQLVLQSRAAPPAAAPSPAIAARQQHKAEQVAAVGLNRTLRPVVGRLRASLLLY